MGYTAHFQDSLQEYLLDIVTKQDITDRNLDKFQNWSLEKEPLGEALSPIRAVITERSSTLRERKSAEG